ncbi:MAG: anion permease, partial [Aridibacter famidurans]|nr:anion permease [Aridibacter famidurans]
MSPIAIVLLLLLLAVVLFATEKLPVDIVGLILVAGLVLTGILTAQESVSGFGDNIIITIAGLFVLTGGLVKTGLVDLIGRRLYRIAGNNEFLLLFLIMMVGVISSTFMNNTTAAAMLVPFVLGLANRAKVP